MWCLGYLMIEGGVIEGRGAEQEIPFTVDQFYQFYSFTSFNVIKLDMDSK